MSNSQQTPFISTSLPTPPPQRLTAAHISIFEIPLLIDIICSHFQSRKEFESCLEVSHLWRELFLPQIHRFVRFADLSLDQTWAVIDYAHCIRDLEIDIQDAGLFLRPEHSTNNSSDNNSDNDGSQQQVLCKNLETLTCVDFGYFSDPPEGLYDPPPPQFDPTTNALGLLAQNPKLCTLRMEYDCAWSFTPSVLENMVSHPSLTRLLLKFQNLDSSFATTLLIHLPPLLQELEILAQSFDSWNPVAAQDMWNPVAAQDVWNPVAAQDVWNPVAAQDEQQQQEWAEWGIQVTHSQTTPLLFQKPNSLKRLVVLEQPKNDWFWFPIPSIIYQFLGICPLLKELSLSSSSGAPERGELLTALKATRPPIKALDLKRMCAHLLKEVIEVLPGLESFTIIGPFDDCETSGYHPGRCERPHREWSQDRLSFRDLTDLVPTLLQFSALTLVHVQIGSALGVQCLEQCPNLKTYIGIFGSGDDLPTLTNLLAKPWACSESLERLEAEVQLAYYCYYSDDKDGAILNGIIQSETYKINRFFHKIKKSSCPRLQKPLIKWYPDFNPWQLSLETALDLVNRNQDGKLVPVEDTLDKDDILGFLGLVWDRQEDIMQEHLEELFLINSLDQPWEPLAGRGGREFFPGFLDTGRRRGWDQCCCINHEDNPERMCYCRSKRCHCLIENSFDRYYYMVDNFEEKIAAGPWFKDRKRLFKTGKSHCRLSPRQKLKQLW